MDTLTKAGDAGIGFDAHPQVHAMADRCRCLDRRDFQLSSRYGRRFSDHVLVRTTR
jgi:hypothetical protein